VVANERNQTGKDASVCWAPGYFRWSRVSNDGPLTFLFGAAKAIGHNRNLAARLPLPKIYPEAIRRTSPELT
jgi:hypothetical protein